MSPKGRAERASGHLGRCDADKSGLGRNETLTSRALSAPTCFQNVSTALFRQFLTNRLSISSRRTKDQNIKSTQFCDDLRQPSPRLIACSDFDRSLLNFRMNSPSVLVLKASGMRNFVARVCSNIEKD